MDIHPNIRAFVFDAYGTLFNVRAIDVSLEKHFDGQARAVSELWRQKQLQYTWLRSLMDRYAPFEQVTLEALRFACQHLGLTLSKGQEKELMDAYRVLDAFPEVNPVLEKLSGQYQLAILSNANRHMLQSAVGHNHLQELIPNVFSIDDIKCYKPIPSVYQLALDGLGLSSEEVAFVSGNTWDIAGASSFGLNTVWLNRKGGTPETLGFDYTITITSLGELLQ